MSEKFKCPVRIEQYDDWFTIVDADGTRIADDGSACDEYDPKMSPETARRIVACVNACEGVTTESVEDCVRVGGLKHIDQTAVNQGKKLRELTKQRDALLAALEKALATVQREGHPFRTWHDEAAAAIAAAKGGAV